MCLDLPIAKPAAPAPPAPARAALDTLAACRTAAYAAFGARRDALFELLDALLTAGPVVSPVHLSLAPVHRRGHGSFSAALNAGAIPPDAIAAMLATAAAVCPLTERPDGPASYGVDTSVWPRCDAETSPERGCSHHAARHAAGKPILRLRSGPPGGRSSGRRNSASPATVGRPR